MSEDAVADPDREDGRAPADADPPPAGDRGAPTHGPVARPARGARPANLGRTGPAAPARDPAGADGRAPSIREDDDVASPGRLRRALGGAGHLVGRARSLDQHEGAVTGLRSLRERLPGDSRIGEPLGAAPAHAREGAATRLARLAGRPSGVSYEVGLGALQLFQAAAESRNRGRGQVDVSILFTDLVGFSAWAVEVGDDEALALLRDVGDVLQAAVVLERGELVKWLGDGMMAVFRTPGDAVAAATRAGRGLQDVERAGHRPRIRAGVHVGRPKRVGRDYLGVDVNVAARVCDAAGPGEVFASDAALAGLGDDVRSRRKRRFSAKGVPTEIGVHALLLD